MQAWKFVNQQWADDIQQGRLRLGLLQSYADLENNRRDPFDGGVTHHLKKLQPYAPDDLEGLRKFGIDLTALGGVVPPNVVVQDITVVRTMPPLYAFCMSRTLPSLRPDEGGGDPAFLITGVRSLAHAIARQQDSKFESYEIGAVTYKKTRFSIAAGHEIDPSPFLKDESFSWEREIRIVFYPKFDVQDPYIVTRADESISSLIKRIR